MIGVDGNRKLVFASRSGNGRSGSLIVHRRDDGNLRFDESVSQFCADVIIGIYFNITERRRCMVNAAFV